MVVSLLAPIVVPLLLVLVSVEAVPPLVVLLEPAEGVLVLAPAAVLGVLLPLVPAAVPGEVVLEPAVPLVPVDAPAPVVPLADEPEPAVPVPLPELWATAMPPIASAAAAAKAVRVFFVVVMCSSLRGNSEGNGLKKAGQGQLLHRLDFHPAKKVGNCRHSL